MTRRGALVVVLLVALAGFPARASTSLFSFRCDGNGGAPGSARTIEAMENEFIAETGYGDCWFHIGHHTYDMGSPHRVGAVTGAVFTVETNFSPPTEIATPTPEQRTNALLSLEGSMDGVSWVTLRTIPYNFRIGRQSVELSFDLNDVVARFLRIRQPRSAAQGLAGYLDSSWFDAEVSAAPQTTGAGALQATRTIACEDGIMERFFDTHPCWFGGVNRYDSPSVFHTYPLGGVVQLARVSGTARFAPWRTDDYFFDSDATMLQAYVETSADGATWVRAGSFGGVYGEAIPFAIDIDAQAAFVRLVAEVHPGAFGEDRHPALKHVRGMLVDSSITYTAA